MTTRHIILAALTAALAAGTSAHAPDGRDTKRWYGLIKAGQNDPSDLSAEAATGDLPDDWQYLPPTPSGVTSEPGAIGGVVGGVIRGAKASS